MEQCVLYIAGQERATLFSLSPCTVFCIIQQWAAAAQRRRRRGFSLCRSWPTDPDCPKTKNEGKSWSISRHTQAAQREQSRETEIESSRVARGVFFDAFHTGRSIDQQPRSGELGAGTDTNSMRNAYFNDPGYVTNKKIEAYTLRNSGFVTQ